MFAEEPWPVSSPAGMGRTAECGLLAFFDGCGLSTSLDRFFFLDLLLGVSGAVAGPLFVPTAFLVNLGPVLGGILLLYSRTQSI